MKIIGVTHQELVENGRSSVFSGEMHENQNLRLTRKRKNMGNGDQQAVQFGMTR